jgi:pullulanase/glycogen debranching enzyme
MGPSLRVDGINFAVFSAHATNVFLCLFDPTGRVETRIPFAARMAFAAWRGGGGFAHTLALDRV